ncbi:ABC transporter substrate-binding protein [Paraliomyxa miuraensis]|uniref:ABC transporter substrate-binding protein n=1 Tax=Paraliomyxa miuraensis TaxID=376150 RepID=UPI002250E6D8|nr:ABC transporter substrate-binding protein [Paraliomyxa miuraensis]MCX4242066.1 ABC transporter substrate-binding protein [Paraliomyxa miuraensis]
MQHNSPVTARMVRRAALGITLGLPLGTACSLVLDLDDAVSCTSDDECRYTTGQGTCVDGFCQPGNADETGDPSTGVGPTTVAPTSTGPDEETTSTTGIDTDTEGSTSTGPVSCSLNSDCGDTERCSDDGICVSLLSAQCDTVQWPDGERDDVVFLGSIMPTAGIFAELVQPLENATQLAIEDFNDHASLPGGRKVAWVSCDSSAGASAAEMAAEHLRDVAGVPAIVGPVFSEAVRQVAEEVTVPADIFVISPTASAPSLSNFQDDNLVWRVTPNDVYQGNAIIDRFAFDLGIDPVASRILVLNKDDAYGNELRDLIGSDLSAFFDNIYFASYPGPETFASQEDLLNAYGEVLGLALGQPGIAQSAGAHDSPDDHYTHVLIIGTSEAEAFIVSYLGIWASNYMFAPFPIITTSHGAVPTLPDIVSNIGTTPQTMPLVPLKPLLFSSLRGTSPNIFDPANFTAFNIRYKIRFNDQDALTSSSLGYDAAMATMFAMATVPSDQTLTGSAVAAGMASLNDAAGTPISFGAPVAVFVQDAVNELTMGSTVDLQGVSGALDWDPDNGEIRADVLGWRLGGSSDMPALDAYCLYSLFPVPMTNGTWVSIGTGMPPCGL